jgi:hypothetical protein
MRRHIVNGEQREGARNGAPNQATTRRGLELGIFLLASVLGIYGIGKGLAGLYERGQEINLLWLAITGFAFFVLAAQMGRVHDTWPHRPGSKSGPTAETTGATHSESSVTEE